ncbi:MAG: biotin--[acetyl-CoA-carboxylase] ligase [Kiritimatiellia bacterium]
MWRIHHKTITESTNLDARTGRPGDVFTADEQTAGRGRLDHRWESQAGMNLMFSAVVDVAGLDPLHVATLPLVVGLAVSDAIARRLPARPVSVKWPNDVLVGGRKIAGVLCERTGDRVIAGVGVNVGQTAFPADLAARATSFACQGVNAKPAEVLGDVLSAFDSLEKIWRVGGFAALWARFALRDCLKGRFVRVMRTDDDGEPVAGRCEGVQADGTLRVAGRTVSAGEAHVGQFEAAE